MQTAATDERTKRAAYVEHRRLARERIGVLRAKLKEAIAARNAKMKEIVAACREHRRIVREQIKVMVAEGRRAIRERADAERRRIREHCAAEKARAKQECDTAIALLKAELRAERKRRVEEKRVTRDERTQHEALTRSHETGAAHAFIRSAMLGALGPLYERVRPTAGESRPEAILRYAETHPDEAHAALHPGAERVIVETKAQIDAAERVMGAPTSGDLERAQRSRKRRAKVAAVPTGAEQPKRKKGELARHGGGMLLEDLLRERDELAAEKALKKEKGAKSKGGLRVVASNNEAPTYGVRWKTEGSGRTGWVLRSGDGSPAWTGSREDADDRARKMTATSRTDTTYEVATYPDPVAAKKEWKLTLVKKGDETGAPSPSSAPAPEGRYGIFWRRQDGAKGWQEKGDKPWTGSFAEVTARVRAIQERAHGFVKHEARPFGEAEERAWMASRHPEQTVKAPELRDTALIAKRIRADIAEAVKKKELPKATYGVRTSKYSMGSSIVVEASKLPFPVINPDAFFVEPGANYVRFDSQRFRSSLTPAAQDVEKKLQVIVDAYNWDRSDYATDYVNVRFHGDVKVKEDEGVWKKMEAAKVAAARGEQ